MSTALRCDGCGAWFGYGTEHRCSPVQFTTATNAVGMSPPPSPPTPTPPEGWEERTEWGAMFHVIGIPPEPLSEKLARILARDADRRTLVTRRVWVEPWREAE